MPPLVVGGMSDAAVRRVIEHDAGWFLLPLPPDGVAEARRRLAEAASAATSAGVDGSGAAPPLIASAVVALAGDPALPAHEAIIRSLTDPAGMFGAPEDVAREMLFHGSPDALAERFAALASAGASRVVLTIGAGDWGRQVELVAEARSRLSR
jgi:alkanesulfonate monooxygenase SsuD/methylene tetrahydromethanopterin reductase-like flavin-dependent oxidoreductase (luciferase family)